MKIPLCPSCKQPMKNIERLMMGFEYSCAPCREQYSYAGGYWRDWHHNKDWQNPAFIKFKTTKVTFA